MEERLTSERQKLSRFVLWFIVGGSDEEKIVELGQQWILDISEILMLHGPETVLVRNETKRNQFVVIRAELSMGVTVSMSDFRLWHQMLEVVMHCLLELDDLLDVVGLRHGQLADAKVVVRLTLFTIL